MLEGNKIGDFNCKVLCSKMEDNLKISYLNLSKNEITNLGVDFICKMLQVNTKLSVLFLHWNRILTKGGIVLAQTLA